MVDPRATTVLERLAKSPGRKRRTRPTRGQSAWLRRGLDQPGGKLPLFDEDGQLYDPRTMRSCIARGWARPWIANPIKPDWLVCRLTEAGRSALAPETDGDAPA